MGHRDHSKTKLSSKGLKLALIVSRYNDAVCSGLLAGALKELENLGLKPGQLQTFSVPGAFEIPWLAQSIAERQKPDAIICLGAVIRGETSHYDYVCQAVTEGILQAMLKTKIPMAFGILTTDNEAQATARSSEDEHNKGLEAARTAVEMALLKKELLKKK